MDLEKFRKILIVRTSALGDVVHVLPALTALRDHFPGAEIGWLVEPLGASLLEGHPFVDRIHRWDRKQWSREIRCPTRWVNLMKEVTSLVTAVRRERYDLVIDFQGNFRSGLAVLLSGGRRRLGFCRTDCRELGGWLFTNRKPLPAPLRVPKTSKNLHLIRELGWEGTFPNPVLPVSEDERSWAREAFENVPGKGPFVTLHPAVSPFGQIKQWPIEYFSELARLLKDEVDARILVTWGPGERDLAERVGHGQTAPPAESIRLLVALISESDLLIGADTGCLHLAAAVGTPLVGIYGPKNPEVYGPHPMKGAIVRSGVSCSPCKLRRCEHRICLSTLFPEDVFSATREVINRLWAGNKPDTSIEGPTARFS